jgi:2-oxoglutarate dehydrogenase E2 component (dihydrolipoamide succinyltransferase)
LTRPSRPPVYKPQNGHEPAPRPAPAQVAQAKAKGPPTDGDALVESITKAISENLARALHQSIAQAVRESMPLSGRTLAQPKVDVGPNLTKAPPKPKPSKAGEAKPANPNGAAPATAPAPAAAAPEPAATGGDGAKKSQFGGTIEAPDEQAKAKLAAAEGGPAAEAAKPDEATQGDANAA